MKLLSLNVEHFRCVRKASIEFGPGLNVLHGPNDLGKSSLAAAIRAALLLQTTSREYEEFVNWDATGVPHVELVFESEPQRIWKVRKTFGSSAQSFLDESRDGVDFTSESRGREVDGRLSEILQWGLAPPGGKGRPKGMPMTFLSTALLAEQDRVAAIFDQALSKDSDESGKKRLISALQAVAEDPLYKAVLGRVQGKFDEAFTANGGKRRGKNSPWSQLSDLIRQKEEGERQSIEHVQRTAAIELELRELNDRLIDRQAAVEAAQGLLQQMEEYCRAGKVRDAILVRLKEARTRLVEIEDALKDLAQAEEKRRTLALEAADYGKRAQTAASMSVQAAQRAQAAKEELARQQSDDRRKEKLLKRASLETRRAELQTEQVQTAGKIEKIRAVEAAATRVQAAEKEGRALAKSVKDLEQRHKDAAESARAAVEREAALRTVGQMIRARIAREALDRAEKGLAQIAAWRDEASRKRASATALENAASAVRLPSPALLADLRQLDQQLQIARGKLDVGLHVRIRPKKGVRLTLQRDGADPAQHELKDTPIEAEASRELRIDIERVAEITLTGGAQSAREEVERLQARWLSEAEPALERANAVNLEHLSRMVSDAGLRLQEIQEARRAAAALDQRAADQPDWAAQRARHQQELTAAEAALGQADKSAAESLASQLRINDPAAAESRLETQRQERARFAEAEARLEAELAGAKARQTEKQKGLSAAREQLQTAKSAVADYTEELGAQLAGRESAIKTELAGIQKGLESLTTESDHAVTAAKKSLEAAEKARVAAEAESGKASEAHRAAERRVATADGEIQMRREAAAKLDAAGARAAVEEIEAELRQAPAPPHDVSEENLREAGATVQSARDELRRIEDEIQAKRGALQHVGGEVSRQKAEQAKEALKAARQREQFQEMDYAAWDLLRTTLLEAEREEGVHLGRALGDPVARRFAELTGSRYGGLELGPDLETHTISASGGEREVSSLSVGTRDQLSTIFRLSLAEHLQSALMLDDQLTQSDAERMQWLRDLIRKLAANIQILVFTCRPADYLTPDELKSSRKSDAKSLVRSINLKQMIQRSGSSAAGATSKG